jgi:hypothetical protein
MSEDIINVETLIEKYFEGFTTLEEEQQLREYFRQDIIPAEWEVYSAMFRFFASERETNETKSLPVAGKKSLKIYFRWAGAAAAVAACLVYAGLKFTFNDNQIPETSCAYINGEAYTNLELIQSETLKVLQNLSQSNKDALAVQIEALEFLSE